MGRILFFAALAFLGWLVWRQWLARRDSVGREDRRAGDVRSSEVAEPMVRCEVCGLNVPRSEAVSAQDHWFCGEEHRRIGRSG